MDTEGEFILIAVVGRTVNDQGTWHSTAFIHARGEDEALERIPAGSDYETRSDAHDGAIAVARFHAKMLPPGDSLAARRLQRGF